MFIDLSKAFDTVDHTVLVQRLKCIGITGHALEWYVNCQIEPSVLRQIGKAGVPQGSILGPLFLIIYINNIRRHIATAGVLFFMWTILFSILVLNSSQTK